jgi:hypothetical protein
MSSYYGAKDLVLQDASHDDVGDFQSASCLKCSALYSVFNVSQGVVFIEEEF